MRLINESAYDQPVSALLPATCCIDRNHQKMTIEHFLPAAALVDFSACLLEAAGSSLPNARAVAEHLVDSDLRGVRSHGLMRVAQYVDELERGEVDGWATPTVSHRAAAYVELDGRRCFGHVAAACAVNEAAAAAAEFGIGLATTTRAGHAGRLGSYTEALTERGCLAIAFCSGPRSGHWVAPFRGVEGRLATNPISFAVPTKDEPFVADFSTSTVPEGVVRRLRTLGQPAPAGALQDAEGGPTDDPADLYKQPRGTILPLGGPVFGHKGYALGLLVEAMTTVLCGEDSTDNSRFGNNVTIVAITTGRREQESATILGEYLRSARPQRADKPVLVPGDPERQKHGSTEDLLVEPEVWNSLVRLGERLGVEPRGGS